MAFVIVCAAVLVMRRTHPDLPRPFRTPFVPLVPILGILFNLAHDVLARLAELGRGSSSGWRSGSSSTSSYGRRHSTMALRLARELAESGIAGRPRS